MRRRNFFVKKSFQSSFAWRFAALIVLEAFLMAVFFLYVSRGTLTTGYAGTELRIERTAHFFFTTFFIISAITAVAIALVGMLVFVILTHRIAGPVYRLQMSIGEILRGNLAYEIRLRRKDEFSELANDVNRLSAFLDSRVTEIRKEVRRAAAGLKDGGPADTRDALKRLEEIADSFKTRS